MKKKTKTTEVALSSPWIEYFHKLEVFFQLDEEIRVDFNDEKKEIKIYVDGNPGKADALMQLLPEEKIFGNISVQIRVIPSNSESDNNFFLIQKALNGNEAVSYIETITPPFSSNPFHYIVFEKEVVQYWNDNLGDINGLESTLYQDLAKEIFEDLDLGGIYFCTDNI